MLEPGKACAELPKLIIVVKGSFLGTERKASYETSHLVPEHCLCLHANFLLNAMPQSLLDFFQNRLGDVCETSFKPPLLLHAHCLNSLVDTVLHFLLQRPMKLGHYLIYPQLLLIISTLWWWRWGALPLAALQGAWLLQNPCDCDRGAAGPSGCLGASFTRVVGRGSRSNCWRRFHLDYMSRRGGLPVTACRCRNADAGGSPHCCRTDRHGMCDARLQQPVPEDSLAHIAFTCCTLNRPARQRNRWGRPAMICLPSSATVGSTNTRGCPMWWCSSHAYLLCQLQLYL
mmetsp:Transcript_70591/g.169131  ORF Transcript_70591/g.169131 Transcript_70591/m.169131 type:complete len:287 (+) Transcript_70591:687-1547(+)